jgi:hypothetical protein
MPLNLLLIHHSGGKRLLGNLPVVDLLLHGALGQKPVDVDWLGLAKPENSEDALNIMRRIPTGIEDNNPVGTNEVDSKSSSFCGYQEESHSVAGGSVEELAPNLPGFCIGGTIHSVIIFA